MTKNKTYAIKIQKNVCSTLECVYHAFKSLQWINQFPIDSEVLYNNKIIGVTTRPKFFSGNFAKYYVTNLAVMQNLYVK